MELTIEHQGRELLHGISLVSRCLDLPESGPTARARWKRELVKAIQKLEALYSRGLPRDFLSAGKPPAAAGAAAPATRARASAVEAETGLKPWQRALVLRLEHGLGRPLEFGDSACITWNRSAETMAVVAPPLLGELRARNLTSNVFRGWPRRSAARAVDDLTEGGA